MILAIDQGHDGHDGAGARPQAAARPRLRRAPAALPEAGPVEHDPDDLGERARRRAARCCRGAREERDDPGDRRDEPKARPSCWGTATTSEPVCRAIVWQDRRTAERCAKLQRTHGAAIRRADGLVRSVISPRPSSDSCSRTSRAAQARRRAPRVRQLDLVARVEAHRRRGARDRSHQRFAHDVVRPAHAKWDRALLSRFGVPANVLPEVRPSAGDLASHAACAGCPTASPSRASPATSRRRCSGRAA